MGFTTLCFIRKNSKELRDLLSGLGYYEINVSEKYGVYKNLRTGTDTMGRICRYMQWYSQESNSCIDCGTNEELFLAIAALRDDTDKYQWFVNEKMEFVFCNQSELKHVIDNSEEWCDYSVSEFHKATVAELIEHFK